MKQNKSKASYDRSSRRLGKFRLVWEENELPYLVEEVMVTRVIVRGGNRTISAWSEWVKVGVVYFVVSKVKAWWGRM